MARKLVALSSGTATGTDTSTGTGTNNTNNNGGGGNLAGTGTDPTDPNAASSGADATVTLKLLGTLVQLTDTDLGNLSKGPFSATQNGGAAPTLFTGANALLVPATVTDGLRAMVPSLGYMNAAIKAVCRFVIGEDPRGRP